MAAVGGWGGRGLLSAALTVLLYRRLSGICETMERLAARFRAGTLGGGRAAGVRPVALAQDMVAVPARPVREVLPRRFGWLVAAAAYQAAGFGLQLRAILEAPEMMALLAASPQARRVLRPVCRMLAIETSVLRPGDLAPAVAVGPEPDAAEDAVRPRVRRKRAPVDWGRIPLPRGVLSAARRADFAKRD